MTRSANEVMNLAAKAARGAGAPPAQAVEFGRAVVCHLIAGRDADALRTALVQVPKGPILSLPLEFARIIENAEKGHAAGDVRCRADLALGQSYAEALPFAQNHRVTSEGLEVVIQTTTPAPRGTIARVHLPEHLAVLMADFAARTFVPESEASRLAGAGAGLTDND